MVQCMSTFMNICYIFCRNVITADALETAEALLKRFHNLCDIFIEEGVCDSISLPHQHTMLHFIRSIILFGSPNGLCSSITESKHIKAVKEPWRQSSRYHALEQMLWTIVQTEKLAALRTRLLHQGFLHRSTASHYDITAEDDSDSVGIDNEAGDYLESGITGDQHEVVDEEMYTFNEDRVADMGPDAGPQSLSSISLAKSSGTFITAIVVYLLDYS